ncbi:E3 UFM1-protein ligase 1 homolog [Cylas formicarius]|uniref:E3 UFM1-protein ligase 1 homolog n=1 Tax=Cylas formicarius TaxID=197179 RepID=UPI0029584E0A|nr:E3 UFM1-protein ligase 1 homolog [Cylas formicarius]XP_060525190.1 E3 UFM1-protein ligase 1 homolog [Cylas formicarius]
MTDWEEVKRLAADFQKVQLSSTTQRLSERNCVEIVSWLIDRKIIDLIFTTDGKEYLTPSQLIQDIQNELYVNGGRINLVELSKIIGVDHGHINAHLNEVLRTNKEIHNVLGQLIDTNYLTKISGEINEKLQQQGQISIGELTLQYDLPSEFLQQLVEKNLGKVIVGKQDTSDPRIFFTELFIARIKAKLRGALASLTRPTPVASILNHIELNEKLFFSLFDQSSMYGSLTSKSIGAQYIPNVFVRSQSEWVNNFYKQNGYLEFDALNRLGIADYKSYLKRQFANEDLIFLNSVVISKTFLDRIDADIEECISSKSYVDLQNSLPSVFSLADIKCICEKVLVGVKSQQIIVMDNYIVSRLFIDSLENSCQVFVEEKAETAVESGQYQKYLIDIQGDQRKHQKYEDVIEKSDKREERRKKAVSGKSGGGTQGRETKTKSTKKHARSSHKNDDEESHDLEESKKIEFLSKKEIMDIIELPLVKEGLEDLVDEISNFLHTKVNQIALNLAADIFATTVADKTATRRQTHNELQNKLNSLITDVRLFEKGIKLLPSEMQTALIKYLCKTLCSDITNEILNYVAAETNLNSIMDNSNIDQKIKFVNELPSEFRTPLLPLVKSLSGQSIDDFMTAVDTALSACSMIIKKVDKKKDRSIMLSYKQQLLEKLNNCEDLAMVLHLATLIIFTSATQCMLHASGKHVPSLLTFLKQYVNEEQMAELLLYHDFVTLMLGNGSEAENAKEKLKEKVNIVKKIANEYKKSINEKP